MKPCFFVNNLNKGPWVYRAVASALAQTIPCEVLITDARSTDNSWDEIQRAVAEAPRGADHVVRTIQSPVSGSNNFRSFSDHWMWAMEQTDAEWVLQCSSDDYSLPDRAKVCMEAIPGRGCAAIACTMFFEKPGDENRRDCSGFPKQTGYVKAGEGLLNLAYGSVIAGYRRDFLKRAGGFGRSTPDVFWGFLAALDHGFYVVCDPQHVHVQHENIENLGFQGKLLAASGDESLAYERAQPPTTDDALRLRADAGDGTASAGDSR
jgi:glycosyltransferase involved in cell wall biosynthesis